jgi:hypothetical protein
MRYNRIHGFRKYGVQIFLRQGAKTQSPLRKSQSLRNLARRLRAPAEGNGHVQRSAMRALWALGEANTSEILEWTCCSKLHRGERLANHDNRAARRALSRIAVRIGRAPTRGRPWVWRLSGLAPVEPDRETTEE